MKINKPDAKSIISEPSLPPVTLTLKAPSEVEVYIY